MDFEVPKREATLAVQSHLGSKAHCHFDVKTYKDNGMIEHQFDGVVHHGGENVPDSGVYVIECAYSPTEEKVNQLLSKCDRAKTSLPKVLHFKSVSKFVPVLGGRLFHKDVEELCRAKGIWRVVPNGQGSGYNVTRQYQTFARQVSQGLMSAVKLMK